MTPTKLLLGQMLVVAAIVVAGIWFATQWVAASLAYQPELGTPWFRLGETLVYAPWSIFPWWFHFDAYAPVVFDEAGAIAAAGGLLGCGAAVAGSVWRARQPAVSVQFSPLISWTTVEPVQPSSVGTTSPTPLPERVGAKAMTCSGPSWRR